MQALGKLKRGKVGGKTWILPELLLYGGAEVHERLLQIFQKAWDKGEVVKDWKDAEIVPIPKKGNLQHCDNWRGISLLDVEGKCLRGSCRSDYRKSRKKSSQTHSAALGKEEDVST